MKLILVLMVGMLVMSSTTDSVANAQALPDVKIVLCGDSTVQDYELGKGVFGWGQVMGAYLNDQVTIVNLAAGGRSTKTFISEKRLDNAVAQKADYAMIQFGHNDSHKKGRPESTDANGDYKEYLKQYIDTFNDNKVKMVFVTPMHRRIFRNGKLVKWLMPYRNAMIEVAKTNSQPLVDLYMHSEKLMEAMGPDDSAYLSCNAKDRSHFSLEGAQAMALCILKDLQAQDHPLAKYIKPDIVKLLQETSYENLAPTPDDQ